MENQSSGRRNGSTVDPFSGPPETSIYPPQPIIEIENEIDDISVSSRRRERSSVPCYKSTGDFLNTLKAFIGTNYQALPFAFHQSGLAFGVAGVFLIACLTNHCCQLLIKCKNYIIDKVCEEDIAKGDILPDEEGLLRIRLASTISYGDMGKRALGGGFFHLIQATIWITQFSTCISYFIFIGNTIYAIFPLVPASYALRNSTLVNHSLSSEVPLCPVPGYGVPMLNIPNIGQEDQVCSRLPDFVGSSSDTGLASQNNQDLHHVDSRGMGSVLQGHTQHDRSFPGVLVSQAQLSALDSSTSLTSSESSESPSTVGPTTTPFDNETTMIPDPAFYYIPDAPDLKVVVLFPLLFFILTSMIRKVRYIAPFSSIATVALAIGACSVLGFLIANFEVAHFEWYKFATLPIFLGQLISAYEGIGCILPIESSMEGNRHKFPGFLHGSITIVFLILCTFGVLGYVSKGEHVKQLIVLDIPQHSVMAIMVDICLVISVLFTYPLQCYPVIDILELYLFSSGRCCGAPRPKVSRLEYDEIDSVQDSLEERRSLLESSIEASTREVSVFIQPSVPSWKRNGVRLLLTLSIAGLAILMRDAYAYLGAFTGAVGASFLALILPCVIHLKLRWHELRRGIIIKDICIVVFAVAASILTLVAIVQQIIAGKILRP